MMIQIPKCEICHKQLYIFHLQVVYDKDNSTIVGVPTCPSCRIMEVTAKELKEWFK